MRDITSVRLLVTKAIAFLLLGAVAAALLIADSPQLRTAALLVIAVWAFARSYYFAFYVIERYIDPSYRFAGIASAIRFLTRRRPLRDRGMSSTIVE